MKLGKLVTVMACVAVLSACDNSKPENIFSAQYTTAQSSLDVATASTFTVPLTIKNTSTATWDSNVAKGPVLAAYHWLDSEKKLLLLDGKRTYFSEPIKPGAETAVQLVVLAPKAPGNYVLQVSLVQEGVSWFESENVKPLELSVKVK